MIFFEFPLDIYKLCFCYNSYRIFKTLSIYFIFNNIIYSAYLSKACTHKTAVKYFKLRTKMKKRFYNIYSVFRKLMLDVNIMVFALENKLSCGMRNSVSLHDCKYGMSLDF